MEQSKKEFYKQNPDKFIEDFFDFELFEWQKEVLRMCIQEPRREFTLLRGRSPSKKVFRDALDIIKKELN